MHEKYVSRGLSVVGVSIDAYPIAVDSERAPTWDAFRVTGPAAQKMRE